MTVESDQPLRSLLESLVSGEQSIDDVVPKLIAAGQVSTIMDSSQTVRLDVDRARRCGFPEVVYASGKTTEQLISAFHLLCTADQNCLATRCNSDQAAGLLSAFPEAIHQPEARTVRLQRQFSPVGKVAVLTAGTSDRSVALEAVETLTWMNVTNELYVDVGVAGPQRFLSIKDRLTDCSAVVVVAGMEGALPSMVAGWLSCPIIAVPTSVGYGTSLGGISALLSMLNSCAANVAVVNIDAGFKAGYLAGLIASKK